MRLLNASTLRLEEFDDDSIPRYAILSHRWQAEEVLFRDIENDTANSKKGFRKLRMACKRTMWDSLTYIWIDTCCIDKSSSAELSEAINSMYRYYEEADRCYAYLYDVETPAPGEDIIFSHSVWFTRVWTLQELLAPKTVIFYDREWKSFGTKESLQGVISGITGIAPRALIDFRSKTHSIAQRMSWAARREATRKEDLAYSLLGLFEVNMPMLYGEGHKAFTRLQEEIIKRSDDQSIFAWTPTAEADQVGGRILARSPAEFRSCGLIYPTHGASEPFAFNNIGLNIELPLIPWTTDTYLAVLRCRTQQHLMLGIFVRFLSHGSTFERVLSTDDTPAHRFELPFENKSQFMQLGFRQRTRRITICTETSARTSIRNPQLNIQAAPRQGAGCYGFEVNVTLTKMKHEPKLATNLATWFMSSADTAARCLAMSQDWSVNQHSLSLKMANGNTGMVGILMFPFEHKPERMALIKLGFDFDFNPVCYVQIVRTLIEVEAPARAMRILKDFDPTWIEAPREITSDLKRAETYQGECSFSDVRSQNEWFFKSVHRGPIHAFVRSLGLRIRIFRRSSWEVVIDEEPEG